MALTKFIVPIIIILIIIKIVFKIMAKTSAETVKITGSVGDFLHSDMSSQTKLTKINFYLLIIVLLSIIYCGRRKINNAL